MVNRNLSKLVRKTAIIAIVLILCLIFGHTVFAETDTENTCGVETSIIECNEGGSGTIFHLLSLALNIMAIGIGILGVIGISVAGVQYLTAGDNTEKVTKAKSRLYEIVIGLACFTVLWSAAEWLLPGGIFNFESDAGEIQISSKDKVPYGQTFSPQVDFQNEGGDKTYSLYSEDESIIKTIGSSAKCVGPGTTKLRVVSSSGSQSETTVTCDKESGTSGSSTSSSSSDDGFKGVRAVDGSPTTGSQLKIKYKGSSTVRPETKAIIKKHAKDFNYKNFQEKIKSYGGYQSYVKNLGGVFQSLATTSKIKVETAADFQAAAEYVFGLWMIWGPDYGNGVTHVSWNGNDAFYYKMPGRSSNLSYTDPSINSMLKTSSNVRTCCNKAINTFHKSTTLGEQYPVRGTKYTKWSQLKVGDVLQFYRPDGRWVHTALVGEVYENYLIIYDGGGRFMTNRNYKIKIPRKQDGRLRSPYSGYGSWYAFRPWTINQSITLAGLNG